MKAGYRNMWEAATVKRTEIVNKVADEIIRDRARYEPVGARTGVPWFWIACVHHRESNRDFRGILHNGQRIIGTGKKTTIVPKGRGPFSSWEEAAVDALTHKSHALHTVNDWCIERMLFEFERWNGWGYLGKINSPYVWAATSQQQRGKYVRDGKFDRDHWDAQLGCAAILKALAQKSQDVSSYLYNASQPKPTPAPNPQPSGFWAAIVALIKALFGGRKR